MGLHKGEPALVQRKSVPVYRDNDRDGLLDFDPASVKVVLGGFNCHKSAKHGTSKRVGKWSAGCQVFASGGEHDILLALCRQSAELYGNSFTYTLLRECEL